MGSRRVIDQPSDELSITCIFIHDAAERIIRVRIGDEEGSVDVLHVECVKPRR
jgi:hypothetical protein